MKVFISWSGARSKQVAAALRDWLKDVLPVTIPFASFEDVYQGEAWLPRLQMELEESVIGVICLTRENLQSSWLLFESGALAKRVGTAGVCTLLVDVTVGELSLPLSAFQSAGLSKDDIFRVVRSIHAALPSPLFDAEAALKKAFEMWWPALDKELTSALAVPAPSVSALQRNTEEFLLPFIYQTINTGEIDTVFDLLIEARNKKLVEPTGRLASMEACLARVAGKSRASASLKLQIALSDEIGALARVEWWFHQFACLRRLKDVLFEKSHLDSLPPPLKYTASALIGLWSLREENFDEARRYHKDCTEIAIAGDPHDYYRAIPTALLCFHFGDLSNAKDFLELARNGHELRNDGYPFIRLIADFDKYFVLSCIYKNVAPAQRDYMRQRRGHGWLLHAYADLVRKKPAILGGLVDLGKTLKTPLEPDAIIGRLKSFQQSTATAAGGGPISD